MPGAVVPGAVVPGAVVPGAVSGATADAGMLPVTGDPIRSAVPGGSALLLVGAALVMSGRRRTSRIN